jgi:exo-1,4-beta-D-glucosaminidase
MAVQAVLPHLFTLATSTPIATGWSLSSSESLPPGVTGSQLAAPGYDVSTSGWYHLSEFPATVLAGLQQSDEYPKLFESQNMRSIDFHRFTPSWWYRVEVDIPQLHDRSFVSLLFKGINYRANIWVNSHLLASNMTVIGAFRYWDLLVPVTRSGRMVLAVEVFRPYNTGLNKELNCVGRNASECVDLAITWVDWAVTPPDVNMGLWREVVLRVTGPIKVQSPMVAAQLSGGSRAGSGQSLSAHLTVLVELANVRNASVEGTLRCTLTLGASGRVLHFEHRLSVPANAGAYQVVLSNETHSQLNVPNVSEDLWWPWQMGSPTMSEFTAAFTLKGGASPSDALNVSIGLRQVSQRLDHNGNLAMMINNGKLLIRGGGWAPDLLQRMSAARHAQELALVRHLGLNTIRLEGKLQDDDLFQQADRLGLLMMPGICCCDAWQAWDVWGDEQHQVAQASLRSQLQRLRRHPSVALFFYSSDELPPSQVEREYLRVFKDERWALHAGAVAAASDRTSTLTGNTGVKMSGPYGWVPPNFWMDARGMSRQYGPAWGFNTETSPGGSPLTRASFERTIPPGKRWSQDDGPTEDWNYHCGSEHGAFGSLAHFTPGVSNRLGPALSYPEYLAKAQLETYESHRAMFEAYSRNKYTSTGVVQWMLNNGWPQFMWHLYDSYLDAGGAFYGAKKAMEPLQLIYSYQDHSIWLVNSRYMPSPALVARAELYGLDGKQLYHSGAIELPWGIEADGTQQVAHIHPWPGAAQRAGGGGSGNDDNATVLLRLLLLDKASGTELARNEYWVPARLDEYTLGGWMEWANMSHYSDMSDLAQLARLDPPLAVHWQTMADADDPTRSLTTIKLSNPSAEVAFFTHIRLLDHDGSDILPAMWEDNFVVLLLSGEARELRVTWRTTDGPVANVEATPYNEVAGEAKAAGATVVVR